MSPEICDQNSDFSGLDGRINRKEACESGLKHRDLAVSEQVKRAQWLILSCG